MIDFLKLKNFTVFKEADLQFSRGLNIIIGENGTGKTHLLKLGYLLSNTWKKSDGNIDKYLSERIRHIFKADKIGSLTTSGSNDGESQIVAKCGPQGLSHFKYPALYNNELSIFFNHRSKENVKKLPNEIKQPHEVDLAFENIKYSPQDIEVSKTSHKAIFIPSKEILSWFEGFNALYEKREVSFDETYKDLAINLELPRIKEISPLLKNALDILAKEIGGTLELDGGKFYLNSKGSKRREITLVAEGIRKLASLLRLIENGSLEIGDTLFWDEPESNLNPKLIKEVALALLFLCNNGIQVIIGTHSLFLLREIEVLSSQKPFNSISQRYFALGKTDNGVDVQQGNSIDEINPFVMLDEELAQSDRFMAADSFL